MTTGGKKTVAWTLAILGFGATYFFAVICAMERPPNELVIYIWPAAGIALSLIAFLYLRRFYREDPPSPPKAFRLQLTDLIVVSLSFAAVMAILKPAFREDKFPVVGPILAFGVVSLLLGGMLAASLHALFAGAPRYYYALIHAVRTFGWMTAGALAACLIYITLDDGLAHAFRFLFEVCGVSSVRGEDSFLFGYLRVGIVAWIVGTICVRRFENRLEPSN